MESQTCIRYTPPGKYDTVPYGTICKVMGDGEAFTVYVQVNKESDHPNWIKTSDLLEKTFQKLIENKEFIDACLSFVDNNGKEDTKDYVTAISMAIETNL